MSLLNKKKLCEQYKKRKHGNTLTSQQRGRQAP